MNGHRPIMLALALTLGGCIAADDVPTLIAPPLPDAAAPWTTLLCAGDVALPVAEPHESCNVKVTVENGPAYEASIAVNPTNPLNLVAGAKDMTLGEDGSCGRFNVWSGVYWSMDGGRSWENGLLPGHSADARRTPLSDYACGSDPVLAFSPEGVAYYVSLMYTPGREPPHPLLGPVASAQSNSAIAISRSADGGATWDDATLVETRENGILDKQWVAVDPADGAVHVTYFDGRAIRLETSRDGGFTWGDPVDIVSIPPDDELIAPGPDLAQFAQVAVGKPGVVHVIYYAIRQNPQDPKPQLWSRTSTDGGATFGEPVVLGDAWVPLEPGVTRKFRATYMPALAADSASGRAYVAWPVARGVHVAASEDGGATWTRAEITDILQPQNDPWMVAAAVAPDGTVHVTWLDYRDDPSGQAMRVYHSFSADGGATWSPNVPLGEVPFDGTGGLHQSGAGTVGDYMGLAAGPDAVHALWADTREGANNLYHAALLG